MPWEYKIRIFQLRWREIPGDVAISGACADNEGIFFWKDQTVKIQGSWGWSVHYIRKGVVTWQPGIPETCPSTCKGCKDSSVCGLIKKRNKNT